ncbi:MAG: DUF3370 domain-containing protein, partial [Cyanobacteria bacterium P01_F01_bin.153]
MALVLSVLATLSVGPVGQVAPPMLTPPPLKPVSVEPISDAIAASTAVSPLLSSVGSPVTVPVQLVSASGGTVLRRSPYKGVAGRNPRRTNDKHRPIKNISVKPKVRRQVLRFDREIRPLAGNLDRVPVFNSNSPEVVRTPGILLSTFPPDGMRSPRAHLNYSFQGRFDIFSHHIARAAATEEGRTLFQGLMVYNPGPGDARIQTLAAASYISRFEAPFRELPAYIEDPLGTIFSGAGSRVAADMLRDRRRGIWDTDIRLGPREATMVMNAPIPVGKITPSSNTRSTLIHMQSDRPVYLASLAMFSPKTADGRETIPTLRQWQIQLVNGFLAGPRDTPPSPLNTTGPRFFYGRIAGVSQGSRWEATLTDGGSGTLQSPGRGRSYSYPISTIPRGTHGTQQVQSAPMLARYPDTAILGHGNYGVLYRLTLPLVNPSQQDQSVSILFETPLKSDTGGGVEFLNPPADRVFFRGPIRLRYRDDGGQSQDRFVHVVQHRGEQGKPLATLNMRPGERRSVTVDLVY